MACLGFARYSRSPRLRSLHPKEGVQFAGRLSFPPGIERYEPPPMLLGLGRGMAKPIVQTVGAMMRNGWSDLAIEIDRTSIVPIYRQIVERLREQILAGALPEGTRLPPERTLATNLTVNRSTVVHAYRDLAVAGLIDQRVGSGSRVAALQPHHLERNTAVPWWATLPRPRSGQFPALLGELAAVERGD